MRSHSGALPFSAIDLLNFPDAVAPVLSNSRTCPRCLVEATILDLARPKFYVGRESAPANIRAISVS